MKIIKQCLTCLPFGAIGGVTFVRLNELYSFMMLTMAGSGAGGAPVGGGNSGGASVLPVAPTCTVLYIHVLTIQLFKFTVQPFNHSTIQFHHSKPYTFNLHK